MARDNIQTPNAPSPPPTYSQAVRAAGLVFVSGDAEFNAYRSTRCKLTGTPEGMWNDGFRDGSDPLGGGPMAGCGPEGVSI
jgi:hypothetical protein